MSYIPSSLTPDSFSSFRMRDMIVSGWTLSPFCWRGLARSLCISVSKRVENVECGAFSEPDTCWDVTPTSSKQCLKNTGASKSPDSSLCTAACANPVESFEALRIKARKRWIYLPRRDQACQSRGQSLASSWDETRMPLNGSTWRVPTHRGQNSRRMRIYTRE